MKLVLEVEDSRGPGALQALYKIVRHTVVDFGNWDFIHITRAEFVNDDGSFEQADDFVSRGATFAEVFGSKC